MQSERRAAAQYGWVDLNPETARTHPEYGVYGWALVLLGALFVGPGILLWQDVEIAFGPYDRPSFIWIQLLIDGVLLTAAWNACRFLGGERAEFYRWYAVSVLIALVSLASFVTLCLFDVQPYLTAAAPAASVDGTWLADVAAAPSIVVSGMLLRATGLVAATLYVLRSRRLRVTVAKRTLADDPFLRRVGPQTAAE